MKTGPKKKPLSQLGQTGRWRRVSHVRTSFPDDDILYTTKENLSKKKGGKAVNKILEMAKKSPGSVGRMLKSSQRKQPIRISNAEALAFMLRQGQSRLQYIAMKKMSDNHNAKIWPCYDYIIKEKILCYPEVYS